MGRPAFIGLITTDLARLGLAVVVSGGLVTAFFPAQARAQQTVYKTVEGGVPSFSDTAPPDGEAVEVITLQTVPAADDALLEQRLDEMRSTTDRMVSDRRERELHRAALREQRQEPVAPALESVPMVVANGGYWSGYRRPHQPNRPSPPYRPGHSVSPVAPPGWSVMQSGNSQLMRSVLPPRQ
jgi:hypothetical protein